MVLIATLCLPVEPAAAGQAAPDPSGWQLERGVEAPSYAWAAPLQTDLDIDSVVLSCEQGPSRRGLQLRLYLSGPGPLAPRAGGALKDAPGVAIAVDGVSYPAQLYFADDFVLVADAADETLPLLSAGLIDALESGRRLALHFDLVGEAGVGEAGVGEAGGGEAVVDGVAAVDLQAGAGGAAIAALRRCTGDVPVASAALSGR